jgi:1-acyl-sn-glycerol-3-phosphate acyltransferase
VKALLRHPIRVIGRLLWICAELIFAALTYIAHCAFRPKSTTLSSRATWLQYSSRRFLRIFGVTYQTAGDIPTRGLLVSNHLSYLDVLLLASITPAVFVAKREVKFWPVFGWFANLVGTVFVNRERRTQVGKVNNEIQSALDQNVLVILFPEGTSSDGKTILPFKSSLLEPATNQTHPISISLIEYALDDGDVVEEVCYWRDMTFLPHAINLTSKRGVRAYVRFGPVNTPSRDRKQLAIQLHAELLSLKAGSPGGIMASER